MNKPVAFGESDFNSNGEFGEIVSCLIPVNPHFQLGAQGVI